MGAILAEWNRTDLSQFVSGGAPDFIAGGGGGGLSVAAVSERGNVLVYTPSGGATVTEIFMFSQALVHADERRDLIFEMELYDVNFGAGGYIGPFFLADADSPLHGFGHCAQGIAEWQTLLNNGVVERSGATGTAGNLFARYHVNGRKPASAPPEISSFAESLDPLSQWHDTAQRRSGSSSGARGGVNEFGSSSTLGASWDPLSCNRFGIIVQSSGGNPPPTQVRIQNFRVIDPFSGGGGGGAAPVVTFVSPAASSPIKKTQSMVFDVTDVDNPNPALLSISIRYQETGAEEVVWRDGRFAALYASSTQSSITDGFRFTVNRQGGWPSTPTLQVDVADDTGQVA